MKANETIDPFLDDPDDPALEAGLFGQPAVGPPDADAEDPDWMPPAPDHIQIRHDTITSEYGQIGRKISEQGRVYAMAVYRAHGAEARRKAQEAALALKVRAHLNLAKNVEGKVVKPTEPQIEHTMRGQAPWRDEFVRIYDEEAAAMAAKEAAKADLQALIASAQLLKEGAQDRRAEAYNIDPRVMGDPAQRSATVNAAAEPFNRPKR